MTLALAEPAPKSVFAAQFQRLASHYPATPLTAPEREVVIRDWRDMLGHLPADILSESVRRYIMSPARFFPTPGQLWEIAKPLQVEREHLARRASEAMEMIG